MQTRHEEQRDDSLCCQPPDGSDGHGLKHVRAFAQVQSQGRETDHRGDGGHQARAETNLRGLKHCPGGVEPLTLLQFLGECHQQYAVVHGQRDHYQHATYAAATALVHGFGLDLTAAFRLLWNEYNPRCQPPWSERELRHKVDDAGSKPHDQPYGWLRDSKPPVCNNGAAVDLSGMTGRRTTTIAPAIASRKLRLRCLADVEPTPIDWLWYGRIALGKLTVIAGHAGLGKSFLTCDIAARVSAGLPWPDEVGACPQGDVLVLNAEDDPGDTIRPRLDAAGADVRRVHFIDGVDGMTAGEIDPFDLARDSRILREHIEQTPGVKLVTIDPVTAYVGQVDDHRNSEVRGLLRPLAELARDTGVAIVIVTHLNKGAGEAINRVIGSIAWGAAARAVWAVIRDPADADRRLFLNIKNNLGLETLGLAYRIAPPSDGEGLQAHVGTPRIEWEDEPLKIRADDIMVGQPDAEPATAPAAPARSEAESFLREVLKDGPVPTKSVQAEARAAGIKWATVRRAKDALRPLIGSTSASRFAACPQESSRSRVRRPHRQSHAVRPAEGRRRAHPGPSPRIASATCLPWSD